MLLYDPALLHNPPRSSAASPELLVLILQSGPDVDTIELFLDRRARLDDRTILIYAVTSIGLTRILERLPLRFIPPSPGFEIDGTDNPPHAVVVIEVNAKYLLQKRFQSEEESRRSEKVKSLFDRSEVQEVHPHRRILLVHPDFGEVSGLPDELSTFRPSELLTTSSFCNEDEAMERFAEPGDEDSESILDILDGAQGLFQYTV